MQQPVTGVELRDPDRANLLALVLERLIRRASGPRPKGSYCLRVGAMCARLSFEGERVVITTEGTPADCEVEGSLATLTALARGASPVAAWWKGQLRWRGGLWRALRLARFLRIP